MVGFKSKTYFDAISAVSLAPKGDGTLYNLY
jgi:hypothetical protein